MELVWQILSGLFEGFLFCGGAWILHICAGKAFALAEVLLRNGRWDGLAVVVVGLLFLVIGVLLASLPVIHLIWPDPVPTVGSVEAVAFYAGGFIHLSGIFRFWKWVIFESDRGSRERLSNDRPF
jgi:hypothetical protein